MILFVKKETHGVNRIFPIWIKSSVVGVNYYSPDCSKIGYIKKMPKFILFMIMLISLNTAYSLSERGVKILPIQNKQGKQIGLYKESHALVIGVSNYTHGWPSLPGVKIDIKAVSKALQKNGFHVVKIIDPNSRELGDAFTHFITQYGNKIDNRLLFYFAGHGYTRNKKLNGDLLGYIVPTDAPNPQRDLNGFLNTALLMKQMEVYTASINAKHALFLFDSCFSGTLFTRSRAIPELISEQTTKPVRQFITAGTAQEKVPDVSIFRQQFIAALNGEGDQNHDGYLTGTELGQFLQNTVTYYSQGAQHPQYGKSRYPQLDKGDFIFKVKSPSISTEIRIRVVNTQENNFWNSLNKTDIDELKAYLDKYPNGNYKALAQIKLKHLQQSIQAKPAILNLNSNVYPNQVWINGKNKGSTRLYLKLTAGNYSIKVIKEGFKPYYKDIYLESGIKKTIHAHLERLNQGKHIGQYIIYTDNTVKDTQTGLVWKRCTEGLSGNNCLRGQPKTYTWSNARKLKNIRYASYLNWRLPTIQELNTLSYCSNGYQINYKKEGYDNAGNCDKGGQYQKPTINQRVFPNTSPENNYIYWSASPYRQDNHYAWVLNLLQGNDNAYQQSNQYFVRLVQAEK